MVQFAISRVLWLIPTLLAMALVTFLVMHATPGSPLDPVSEGANPLSPEAQRNLAAHYGLDRPLHEQFVIFLRNALHGDFGNSLVMGLPVGPQIASHLPVTLVLTALSLIFAIMIGLPGGVVAALRRRPPSWP